MAGFKLPIMAYNVNSIKMSSENLGVPYSMLLVLTVCVVYVTNTRSRADAYSISYMFFHPGKFLSWSNPSVIRGPHRIIRRRGFDLTGWHDCSRRISIMTDCPSVRIFINTTESAFILSSLSVLEGICRKCHR